MCTVTVFLGDDEARITMNRDERLERAPETPPFEWDTPQITAPKDPVSGGTWMGARKDGVWACLLNGYLEDHGQSPIQNAQSRGRLVLDVLDHDDPLSTLKSIDLSRTHSFRFWVGNGHEFYEYFWDTKNLSETHHTTSGWHFVTSSSWNQPEVQTHRAQIFETWKQNGAEHQPDGLPLIHIHQKPNEETWGVLMRRDYAKTKSVTQITISRNQESAKHELSNIKYWSESDLEALITSGTHTN